MSMGTYNRDLKPENVLIDSDGHIKIANFGLAKQNDASTQTTFCGTPDYMAPEILQQKHYTKDDDKWALGILLFEMLTGMCPFYDDDINQMTRMIIGSDVDFPSSVSPQAKELISQLLCKNRNAWLGSGISDYNDIKKHPFFSKLDWNDVLNKTYKLEWIPRADEESGNSYFPDDFIGVPVEKGLTYDYRSIKLETQDQLNAFNAVNQRMLANIKIGKFKGKIWCKS